MKCYITSIGEQTTDLAAWSVNRFGFEPIVIKNDKSLGEKLKFIYHTAKEDFIRMDADIIMTADPCSMDIFEGYYWIQYSVFDLYQMRLANGGIQLIKQEIIPVLRENIDQWVDDDRPETRMWNLSDIKGKTITDNCIIGLHGFGQKDIKRVEAVKSKRKNFDNYDFELAYKMAEYYK